MEKSNPEVLKEKIIRGVIALTSRTLFLQIVSLASTFILTILLSPSVFGVFFIVSALISFLTYFSDIGLAAALIQKKEEPTKQELASVFTIQQLLVILIISIGWLLVPIISRFYKLDNQGVFLLHIFLISFFLSSLKTIPSILLERKLEFDRLIIPQIAETVFFYLIAIIFAWAGFGITAFAWAVLGRGIIGTLLIYLIKPWRIQFGISFKSSLGLLRFGIPFQANSLLALVKDDLMTLFLGRILPLEAVGYIGWAKKWAEMPLRLIMDSVIRVTFPTFSRMQHDKIILKKALEKAVFFLALFVFPITIIMAASIKPLIYLIPKYQKWEPALTSFYLFAFASIWASFSSPIVNALNALGKVRITLQLMVFWTIITWILVPLLVNIIGYPGFAFSAFIISFTSIIPLRIMQRFIPVRFIFQIKKPLILSFVILIMTLIIFPFITSLATLIFSVGFVGILYILLSYFFVGEEIKPYLMKFLKRGRKV